MLIFRSNSCRLVCDLHIEFTSCAKPINIERQKFRKRRSTEAVRQREIIPKKGPSPDYSQGLLRGNRPSASEKARTGWGKRLIDREKGSRRPKCRSRIPRRRGLPWERVDRPGKRESAAEMREPDTEKARTGQERGSAVGQRKGPDRPWKRPIGWGNAGAGRREGSDRAGWEGRLIAPTSDAAPYWASIGCRLNSLLRSKR